MIQFFAGKMNRIKTILLFIAVSVVYSGIAQKKDEQILFKNGDRVCFIGNSITNNGEFYNLVNLFYATRYPDEKVVFYNCGISGDVADGVIRRMNEDILIHKPVWSVVMLGMNDVSRSLYARSRNSEPGIEKIRQATLDLYRERMGTIVKTLLANNSKVILQKPTIYDQTGVLTDENFYGVNDALEICCGYIDELAKKYNLTTVDYWTILKDINQKIQRIDSTKTIIGSDRVHPSTPGHFVMAYEFLKSTIKPNMVSRIFVNSRSLKTNCDNCVIESANRDKETIFFSCKENSLPFPIRDEAEPALAYIPFVEKYDQEILEISNLRKGSFNLFIDDKLIGAFTDIDFKKGINLALLKEMPQYKQASELALLFMEYRKTEAKLRSLKLVEFVFMKDVKTTNMDSLRSFFDRILITQYSNSDNLGFYTRQFKSYIEFKPRENDLEKSMGEIVSLVYKSNKPQTHLFKITKRG